MKSLVITTAVSVMILLFNSCSSDLVNGNIGNPPGLGGYDINEAGVIMTLASLCYTAENNPNHSEIKDSLILQLSDSTYATNGNWKLAWGPGISPGGGNMMYVAVDSTSDTIYYTIAIRGTDWNFPSNIQQDMEVWKLDKFPYSSNANDSVAAGSLYGLDTLLAITDSNITLAAFLTGITGNHLKMYITGHSLGGALATMLTAWFINSNYTSKFTLETYTFAAPTVGNVSFANHYNSMVQGANVYSHRVVNSKDLVPYGWADLESIVPNQIPTFVPIPIGAIIIGVGLYLDSLGIQYKHVDAEKSIGSLTPTNCSSGNEEENYFCWVGFEHSHNNYLRLLSADTVRVTKTR